MITWITQSDLIYFNKFIIVSFVVKIENHLKIEGIQIFLLNLLNTLELVFNLKRMESSIKG